LAASGAAYPRKPMQPKSQVTVIALFCFDLQPCIIGVREVIDSADTLYIVMEL